MMLSLGMVDDKIVVTDNKSIHKVCQYDSLAAFLHNWGEPTKNTSTSSKRNMTTCLYRNKKLFLLDFSTFIDTTYVGRVEENELDQFISELYN